MDLIGSFFKVQTVCSNVAVLTSHTHALPSAPLLTKIFMSVRNNDNPVTGPSCCTGKNLYGFNDDDVVVDFRRLLLRDTVLTLLLPVSIVVAEVWNDEMS